MGDGGEWLGGIGEVAREVPGAGGGVKQVEEGLSVLLVSIMLVLVVFAGTASPDDCKKGTKFPSCAVNTLEL